jgi:ABC-type Na+ efflux pump permease subunit
MKNTLAVTALVALVTVSTPVLVWGADIASDTERAKRQAAVFPTLQEAAASATGYKKTSIEVKSTAHQVTIAVVNSKLNDGSTTERTAEASTIASACAKTIAGKSEFATVVIIHVDYVGRLGNNSTLIQGIDFNKAPDGSFKLHLT